MKDEMLVWKEDKKNNVWINDNKRKEKLKIIIASQRDFSKDI